MFVGQSLQSFGSAAELCRVCRLMASQEPAPVLLPKPVREGREE